MKIFKYVANKYMIRDHSKFGYLKKKIEYQMLRGILNVIDVTSVRIKTRNTHDICKFTIKEPTHPLCGFCNKV